MQTVPVKPKPMLLSKTFWLNIIFGLVGVIAMANEIVVATTDLVTIPAEVTRWLLLLNTAANIVLRRISDQPARFTTQDDEPVYLKRA